MLLGHPNECKKLLDLTEDNEGYRQFAYQCSANKNTIGIGFNLDDVGLSIEESRIILQLRLGRIDCELMHRVSRYTSLDEVRRAALCDMSYQLGVNGLLNFKKSLALLSDECFESAADEFLNSRWARQTPQRAKKITGMIRTGEWPS